MAGARSSSEDRSPVTLVPQVAGRAEQASNCSTPRQRTSPDASGLVRPPHPELESLSRSFDCRRGCMGFSSELMSSRRTTLGSMWTSSNTTNRQQQAMPLAVRQLPHSWSTFRWLCKGAKPKTPREQGNVPRVAGLLALAHHFDELLGDGVVRDYAELAAFVKWRRDALTSRSAVSHRYLTRADVPHEGNSLWGDGSGGPSSTLGTLRHASHGSPNVTLREPILSSRRVALGGRMEG